MFLLSTLTCEISSNFLFLKNFCSIAISWKIFTHQAGNAFLFSTASNSNCLQVNSIWDAYRALDSECYLCAKSLFKLNWSAYVCKAIWQIYVLCNMCADCSYMYVILYLVSTCISCMIFFCGVCYMSICIILHIQGVYF